MLETFIKKGWIVSDGDQVLSVIVNPREFERVINRRVCLRLNMLGLLPLKTHMG